MEAKYLRFPAKKFAETQINYESNESSYGKQGLKNVDIDPLTTMSLLQKNHELLGGFLFMTQDNIRNYIKARITEEGYNMDEVLQLLHEEYQWSRSLSNFSAKLSRGTLRYTEAVQIADILGYDVIWKKRGDR